MCLTIWGRSCWLTADSDAFWSALRGFLRQRLAFVRPLVDMAYVVFATIAFTAIVIQRRPDQVPTAGIGTVFLLPAILLLGNYAGYFAF
jgi:hypothetical protein